MEESYFAFLGNAKKIVTDTRVDAVINEFTPTDGERKVRPRTNPGVSKPGGSLPSIPSLPSVRSGSQPSNPSLSSVSGINGFGGGSSTQSGVRSSAAAALAELEARRAQTAPVPLAPGKSNVAWIVVVALIVIAVALLGFVLFSGKH
jgi:hypothetical protein